MARKYRIFTFLPAILAAILLASGCGGGTHDTPSMQKSVYEDAVNASGATGMPTAAREYDTEMADEAVVRETATAESDGGDMQPGANKKIVWTGSLRVESTEYEKTLGEIQDLIARNQALVESSNEYDGSDWYKSSGEKSRTMYWQLRIPSANFHSFFEESGSLTGQIRSKGVSSSGLTKRYSDTAIQIESLTIQQENLMEMMKQAKKIEDMLQIEDRLSEIRYQLKSLQDANSQIDYDVDFSFVDVTLSEVHVYEKSEISYLQRLRQAAEGSLLSFIEALGDFLVNLLYALPYIIILALIFLIVRAIPKRRKAKKEEKGKLESQTNDTAEAEKE